MSRGELIAPPAGAVGRVVVDDEHVGVGQLRANRRHERGQILDFVVGGEGDESIRFLI